MVTTHHTQMCYMLHLQYTNKCEIDGLMGGERGGVGGHMGRVGGGQGARGPWAQGGMEVPHLPLPRYSPLTLSTFPICPPTPPHPEEMNI